MTKSDGRGGGAKVTKSHGIFSIFLLKKILPRRRREKNDL